MSNFNDGLKQLEDVCGNGRDNVITLSTICINDEGLAKPYSRDVDAYYEDGAFYIMTLNDSLKIKQIENNPNVAFSVCEKWISGNGVAKNLGYVMKEKNAQTRLKLREAFKFWYDFANDESSENTIILKVEITEAIVIKDHNAIKYYMDFTTQEENYANRSL